MTTDGNPHDGPLPGGDATAGVPVREDAISVADPDLRGPRLEVDYLTVELALRRHGIDETIVVFGSARVLDPQVAERRLADLRARASEGGRSAPAGIRDAERDLDNARYYAEARAFGRLVGCIGRTDGPGKMVIMTGGGPGIMEAANRGALDVGALSVGLNIFLPREQAANPYITPGLAFELRYFAIRKLHLLLRAKALVAFPGGFGTLDELFETLNLIQTGRIDPMPVILIGRAFWDRVIDFDFLAGQGMVGSDDRSLFRFAETAQGAWDEITAWYAKTGKPFLGGRRPICPAANAIVRAAAH